MSSEISERLLGLQNELAAAEKTRTGLEAKLEAVTERLKKEFDVEGLDAARDLHNQLLAELQEREAQLKTEVEAIEEEWKQRQQGQGQGK